MLKPLDVMKLPEGKHCDGDYLWLYVVGASRSWVVRTPMINGKRREIGLGSAAKISLALARKHRDALLEQLGVMVLTSGCRDAGRLARRSKCRFLRKAFMRHPKGTARAEAVV